MQPEDTQTKMLHTNIYKCWWNKICQSSIKIFVDIDSTADNMLIFIVYLGNLFMIVLEKSVEIGDTGC